jgi:hypothetical protein
MRRIGIAASHIARGSLFLYNSFVILISFLCSLLVFVISGLAIILGLFLISYLAHFPSMVDFKQGIVSPLSMCLICLAIVTVLFNLYAIGMNIKIK